MRAGIALLACIALSACATARLEPVTATPAQPGPPAITPVTLADLRGSTEVLIFPDIDVPTTVARVEEYVARCLAADRRVSEPNGLSIYRAGAEPYLGVTVATISRSSALGIRGSGVTPDLKEALAATVQGRPRCAA